MRTILGTLGVTLLAMLTVTVTTVPVIAATAIEYGLIAAL
jgi:hypothetical protein